MLSLCSSISIAAACLFSLVHADSAVCYGSNGNQNPNLLPCDSSSNPSACCSPGDICYSNGLCENPNNTAIDYSKSIYTIYNTQGCTKPDGSTGECIPFDKCRNSGGIGITVCGTNSYCCYGLTSCNCSNPAVVFTLNTGTILTTFPLTIPTSTTTTSPIASSSTIVSSSSSATSNAAMTTSANSGSSSNGTAVGAGVGIGVGVALLLIAGLGLWLWRRHRQRQSFEKAPTNHPAMDPYQGYTAHAKHSSYAYAPAPQTEEYALQHQAPTHYTSPSELDGGPAPAQLDSRPRYG